MEIFWSSEEWILLSDVTSFQFHINRMVVFARFSCRFVVVKFLLSQREAVFCSCLSYFTVIKNDPVHVSPFFYKCVLSFLTEIKITLFSRYHVIKIRWLVGKNKRNFGKNYLLLITYCLLAGVLQLI